MTMAVVSAADGVTERGSFAGLFGLFGSFGLSGSFGLCGLFG
jgi:hypothetical protein